MKRTYKRLTPEEIRYVDLLLRQGWGVNAIADELKRAESVIRYWRARLEATKSLQGRQNRAKKAQNGRQQPVRNASFIANRRRWVANIARRVVVKEGRTRPAFCSAGAIATVLARERGVFASRWTVLRDLKATGHVPCVRRRVPTTAASDHQRRKAFATRGKRLIATSLAFSDEKIFTCNDYTRRTQWVKKGSQPLPRENARFPVRCMVWAVIAHDYVAYRILPNRRRQDGRVDEHNLNSLTSESYRHQVLPRVVPEILRRRLVFQQDGARPHTAAATMAYLRRRGVRLMEGWPPRSPDLNPIETLWAHLAPRVAAHFPLTHAELVSAIHSEFSKLQQRDIALVNSLVDSFPARCRRVAARDGGF